MLTATVGSKLQNSFKWLVHGMEVNIYFAELSGVIWGPKGEIIISLGDNNLIKESDEDGVFSLVLSEEEVQLCSQYGQILAFEIYGKQPYLERSIICKGTLEIEIH